MESWIDYISDLWGEIEDGEGGTLNSFHLFDEEDWPEVLTDHVPAVLTYPNDVTLEYSESGPHLQHWTGVSEFHLTHNTHKQHYPFIVPFYRRIIQKAAANRTLGGNVETFFLISETVPALQGIVTFDYGDEVKRLGLVVNWRVRVSETLTLGN